MYGLKKNLRKKPGNTDKGWDGAKSDSLTKVATAQREKSGNLEESQSCVSSMLAAFSSKLMELEIKYHLSYFSWAPKF